MPAARGEIFPRNKGTQRLAIKNSRFECSVNSITLEAILTTSGRNLHEAFSNLRRAKMILGGACEIDPDAPNS